MIVEEEVQTMHVRSYPRHRVVAREQRAGPLNGASLVALLASVTIRSCDSWAELEQFVSTTIETASAKKLPLPRRVGVKSSSGGELQLDSGEPQNTVQNPRDVEWELRPAAPNICIPIPKRCHVWVFIYFYTRDH